MKRKNDHKKAQETDKDNMTDSLEQFPEQIEEMREILERRGWSDIRFIFGRGAGGFEVKM